MHQVRRISVAEDELGTRLLDELRGHVFHVTTHVALPIIRETGSILANPEGQAVKTLGVRWLLPRYRLRVSLRPQVRRA